MSSFNSLEIYPTNHCQLACTECSLHSNKEEWTKYQLDSIINSSIFSKINHSVNILGGEPTSWKYLNELIKEIRLQNKKCSITVTSNGYNISDELIEACKTYNASINISWHGYDFALKSAVILHKKKLLKNIIFTPSDSDVFSKYESLKLLFGNKCVFRPLVGPKKIINFVNYHNKLLKEYCGKNSIHVQSFERIINGQTVSNIDLIKSLSYTKYKCKCGHNAVLYTDGNLYHCLSQAIGHKNPINMYQIPKLSSWIDCKYEFCCCDTFDLRTK